MNFDRKKDIILKVVILNSLILLILYSYNEFQYINCFGSDQLKFYKGFKKVYFESYCQCRRRVFVEQHPVFKSFYRKDDYYILFESDIEKKTLKAIGKQNVIHDKKIFVNPRFTCDLNHVLTHGPNVKVLSFSLYGQHKGYNYLIETIVKTAQKLYPDWIIRIYYDNSIDKSIICNLECKYESIYFCNVNYIPFKYINNIDLFNMDQDKSTLRKDETSNNLTYVNGMKWYELFNLYYLRVFFQAAQELNLEEEKMSKINNLVRILQN